MLDFEAFKIPALVPYELNAADPTRMMIGASRIYESFHRGTSELVASSVVAGDTGVVTAIAYGGADAPDWAYVGYELARGTGSAGLFRRTTTSTFELLLGYRGSLVRDIAVHPDDVTKLVVLDADNRVWASSDSGETFTDVTGNLTTGGVLNHLQASDL